MSTKLSFFYRTKLCMLFIYAMSATLSFTVNFTNRPNPPIQKNCCNFWTNDKILMFFANLNDLSLCIIYYDLKHHLKPHVLSGVVKYFQQGLHTFLINKVMEDTGVCRAAPGFPRICKLFTLIHHKRLSQKLQNTLSLKKNTKLWLLLFSCIREA